MKKLNQLKHRAINKFTMGLYCLGILSAVSCDNEKTKTEVMPTLQKVNFAASTDPGKKSITLSDYSTVKLFITTDDIGSKPAHYYVGINEKTFEKGGTKFTIEKDALSIYLKSASGEDKKYYVQQFDMDAKGKASYRLAKVISFNLKDKEESKSVNLALVENKTKVEGETTTATKEKSTTKKPKKATETSDKPVSFALSKEKVDTGKQFFFYVQFQKLVSGKTPEYYKGADKDISNISFKLKDENGTIYYKTSDFFGQISKSGKAADKFKITLPAEASIYKNKTLTISEVSITMGGEEKTFTVSYYDANNKKVTSIQKGGKVTFIPPTSASTARKYADIPDKIFREYLKETIPSAFNKENKIDTSSNLVKDLKKIEVSKKGIKNLEGIEYFTGLKELYCTDNQLNKLDVSENKALEVLYCSRNPLEGKLIVKDNKSLIRLACRKIGLATLDLSQNIHLSRLYCQENQITQLNLSQNKLLLDIHLWGNPIISLDIRGIGHHPMTDYFVLDLGSTAMKETLKAIKVDVKALRYNFKFKEALRKVYNKNPNLAVSTYDDRGDLVCKNYNPVNNSCLDKK